MKPNHPVTVTVDNEPVALADHKITPNALLIRVGLDPATHYLVLVHGHARTSLQGRGDETLTVHDGERFVSLSTGPTTTS